MATSRPTFELRFFPRSQTEKPNKKWHLRVKAKQLKTWNSSVLRPARCVDQQGMLICCVSARGYWWLFRLVVCWWCFVDVTIVWISMKAFVSSCCTKSVIFWFWYTLRDFWQEKNLTEYCPAGKTAVVEFYATWYCSSVVSGSSCCFGVTHCTPYHGTCM